MKTFFYDFEVCDIKSYNPSPHSPNYSCFSGGVGENSQLSSTRHSDVEHPVRSYSNDEQGHEISAGTRPLRDPSPGESLLFSVILLRGSASLRCTSLYLTSLIYSSACFT